MACGWLSEPNELGLIVGSKGRLLKGVLDKDGEVAFWTDVATFFHDNLITFYILYALFFAYYGFYLYVCVCVCFI